MYIHYVIEDEGVTKYVEVKTLSGNTFHLSREEKKNGKKNKENYEIWLVQGTDIIPIKDFFVKPIHNLQPYEYLVTLELEFN